MILFGLDASCDDTTNISQYKKRIWATDKLNTFQPSPRSKRLLVIRGEGASKFADVYVSSLGCPLFNFP